MKVHIGKYPKNSKKERKISVKIDSWDTWNMDSTLALIILPMLKQLKEQKGGAPFVEMNDVPEHLRAEIKDGETDDLHFARWDYVLDEMIFAFESYCNDWEDTFWKTKPELDLSEHPEDEGEHITPVRWKVEGDCDWDGMRKYQERIQNGLRLFGTYYSGLWS